MRTTSFNSQPPCLTIRSLRFPGRRRLAIFFACLGITLAGTSPVRANLETALDAVDLTWATGGAASWIDENSTTHDGADAAQSGSIGNSSESWIQTSVTGPGTLSFWWKVSSESGYDYLALYVDGVLISGRISGEVNWSLVQQTIAAGTHTVRWRYSKDSSDTAGADTGWVDQISFAPGGPPVITADASEISLNGAKLNGFVNPQGLATTAFFEFGTTTAYGSTTAVVLSPANGSGHQAVSASVGDLQKGTLYHFRLVASNTSNPAPGADLTFTTTNTDVFFPTASMSGSVHPERNQHTATVLADGRVLVAGGYNSWPPYGLSTAELYDPSSGTWAATGSLLNRRAGHIATLLPDGRVLVVGGDSYNGGGSNLISELYTPANGTWSSGGSLPAGINPGSADTATLLPNGKVLVVASDKTALYDSTVGSWAEVAPMLAPRRYPAAVLLPNGRVLVAGGSVSANGVSSAELFDPATGAWTTTGAMTTARFRHTLTLLGNGKVLAAGGTTNASGSLSTAELYDPANGTWTATGSMPAGRENSDAVLLPNGNVLIAGNNSTSDVSAVIYHPDTGAWTATGSMAIPRQFGTMSLLSSGRLLVVGGMARIEDGSPFGNVSYLSSAELYEPSAAPILITGTSLAGTQFTVTFSSAPGLAGWKVMGSSDLLSFPTDKTADSVISETSPGHYQAVVTLAGPPPRYFLRIQH